MRRVLLAFICTNVFLTVLPSSGRSADGRCLIAVDDRTFLNGTCNIEVRPGGSFTVGVGEKSRSKYFAFVDVDRSTGLGHGYWNGVDGEGHAHEDLGVLNKKGACWQSARAKICAWR
jgi:hypothetical protein